MTPEARAKWTAYLNWMRPRIELLSNNPAKTTLENKVTAQVLREQRDLLFKVTNYATRDILAEVLTVMLDGLREELKIEVEVGPFETMSLLEYAEDMGLDKDAIEVRDIGKATIM